MLSAVTAFNFPFQLNIKKLAYALAAGCTVVLKAADVTPWTASALARLVAEETDFPVGTVNMLTSNEVEVAQQLTTDDRIDMVAFVGSSDVGRATLVKRPRR